MRNIIITILLASQTLGISTVIYKTMPSVTVKIAQANGFKVSNEIDIAINNAARHYRLPASELTAIAIVESGIGQNAKTRINTNGTQDIGLFQINTINHKFCKEYDIKNNIGNALCAAKILSKLKQTRHDYVGVYHSKTPSKKQIYLSKIAKVLNENN